MQARRVREDGEEQGEYQYQGNVANRAPKLLGKEFGMFIDRKEVGKPGDFAEVSDDELDARIEELVSRGEGGADEGAQGPALRRSRKECRSLTEFVWRGAAEAKKCARAQFN
jgi:hypothetical protein